VHSVSPLFYLQTKNITMKHNLLNTVFELYLSNKAN
jgi:hypothetical protein